MKVLNINNTCVLIFYDQSGIWTKDKVLIDGETRPIGSAEATCMVEYLFNEGFIQDRRTTYKVVSGYDESAET